VFPCILRPCISYIDLDTLHSTSFYCVLLIILHSSSRFISFTPILFDLLLPTSDYVYKSPHSLTYPYPIFIEPDITLLHLTSLTDYCGNETVHNILLLHIPTSIYIGLGNTYVYILYPARSAVSGQKKCFLYLDYFLMTKSLPRAKHRFCH
jgi:hypothetical protein